MPECLFSHISQVYLFLKDIYLLNRDVFICLCMRVGVRDVIVTGGNVQLVGSLFCYQVIIVVLIGLINNNND